MNLRLKQLRLRLQQPLLVSKKEHLLYLTGHSFIDGYLLVWPKKTPVYFGNGLEAVKGLNSDYISNLDKHIKTGQLEVENHLTLKELSYLKKKLKNVRISPAKVKPIEELRLLKTAGELANLTEAYRITALVFANIKRMLKKEQWTEQGLAQYIRIWGLEYGASDISFEPIVAAGANAAVPHHRPTARIIKPGETVVVDFGFKVNGYCSDFTRTVFLHRAPKVWAKIYQQTEQAYRLAFTGIQEGINGQEADSLARDYLKKVKLDKYFIHSLGHGTGLEVHEQPSLSPKTRDTLQDGMVFSIEPGVYKPEEGGVRIEDLVYLHHGRPQYFVPVATDLNSNIIK
jgi:Xaa-Pro aminopeptidase